MDNHSAKQYSPLALAFLGDHVYNELVAQMLLLRANMPIRKLHRMSVEYVRAGYQAQVFDRLIPLLNEDEAEILRRGRNAATTHTPKGATHEEYSKATAVEMLFGYLKLTEAEERIKELFDLTVNTINNL